MEAGVPGLLAASPKNCTLTNSMELGKNGPSVVWARLNRTTPLLPIPSHMNPLHTLPSCFFKPHFGNILHCTPSGPLPLGFPTKILFEFLFSSIHSTRPALNVLYEFIVLITSGIAVAARSTSAAAHLLGMRVRMSPVGIYVCVLWALCSVR